MDNFDERPIERAPQGDELAPQAPRPSRTPIIIIAVVGLLLGGAGAWWWMRSNRAPAATAPAAAGSSDEVLTPAEPARELPPLSQMDTFLRALLGSLSSNPDFARWLATDDLIRQMAHGIDLISRGQSPSATLPTLRPQEDFQVSRTRREITLNPASYQRYNRLALMVDSLDAKGVVEAYRTVRPRLDEAYRALGRSESDVDNAINIALQNLLATPVPEGPVRLVPGRGATYAYANPDYEKLQPIQKQLMRMGPENVRRIQAKLREIQSLL